MKLGRHLVTTAVLLLAPILFAGDWPHWRGPNLYGVSDEKGLPVEFSHEQNVTWKLPLPGLSGATPIIWRDRIFLNVAEQGSLYLWCVDRTEPKVLWKRHLSDGDRVVRKANLSSSSPVTDGTLVWVTSGVGVLKAFDFDGNEIWARNLPEDYGVFGQAFGYGSSPLLHEGDLILQVLHGSNTDEPSYLVRIDGESGKTVWRVDRPSDAERESPDSYTTPALFRGMKRTELIITGGDYVTGHDPATGKELWRGAGLNPQKETNYRVISSPVVHEDLVYVPTRRNPLQAYRLGGSGDVTDSHLAWKFDRGPDVPSPLADGAYLYLFDDKGVVHCHDAKTGEVIWGPERIEPATYSSSPVLADGKIYMSNEDGQTIVVKAGPEFEVLSVNQMEGFTLSSPAISDGQIFLRTAEWLYCVGDRRQ